MSQRATLHTVAAEAGVSTATVSKVVNGISAGVSEETRKRVAEVVSRLGYRPNRIGRGLRTLRRSTIGMAIVDPSPTFLADPFTTNLVAGLSNALSSRGFGLLLHGVKPADLESSYLIKELEVDALCVTLSGPSRARRNHIGLIAGLGHPAVIFQETADASFNDVCFVRQDDESGARALAELTLQRPIARAVAIIPDIGWAAIERRVEGFRKVLRRKGIRLTVVACDETHLDDIANAVEGALVDEPPDLVIGANDQIALVAMQVLKSRGLSIPRDVAVTGFNGFPFSGMTEPRLTTVRSSAYALGELGAHLVLERLEIGSFPNRERILPVELVEGGSV